MGGHGGLNILPQKKWNVYRRDNQQKVKDDEKELEIARERLQAERAKQTLTDMKSGNAVGPAKGSGLSD